MYNTYICIYLSSVLEYSPISGVTLHHCLLWPAGPLSCWHPCRAPAVWAAGWLWPPPWHALACDDLSDRWTRPQPPSCDVQAPRTDTGPAGAPPAGVEDTQHKGTSSVNMTYILDLMEGGGALVLVAC